MGFPRIMAAPILPPILRRLSTSFFVANDIVRSLSAKITPYVGSEHDHGIVRISDHTMHNKSQKKQAENLKAKSKVKTS
jgi:hypothetical protein